MKIFALRSMLIPREKNGLAYTRVYATFGLQVQHHPGIQNKSYLAIAIALRTFPLAFFNAAIAAARPAPAANNTSATGVRLPEAFRAPLADSWSAPVASSNIPTARCISFSFFGTTLTIRFPYT